jgi:hypothetical protein
LVYTAFQYKPRARRLILNFLALLRFFRTIFRARLFSIFDRCAVEGATDDVIADAGKVFDPTAADQDDAVFLEVMSFAWDVCDDLLAIGQSDPSDLSQS